MLMMFLVHRLCAAEAALADAFRFSGGPLPSGGLVLGRGSAFFRVVQLGGPFFLKECAERCC